MNLRLLCLALRTSGPDARRCSILDFGAVWLHGGPLDASFSRACDAWTGAEGDPEILAAHGLAMRSGDPFADDEREAFRAFVEWSRCDREPLLLCGLKPSHTRAHLLGAANRAGIRIEVPARIMDLPTLYLSQQLAAGVEVPATGYRHCEILAGMGFVPPLATASAIELAALERDLATRIISLQRAASRN